MIFAVDVDYREDRAVAAGVLFDSWESTEPTLTKVVEISEVEQYEPGNFYKRELPCILKLLTELDELPEYIIIDGYVYLNRQNKAGLGKHLYDELKQKSVVIGVAKSRYKDTPSGTEVWRGSSQKPLYINAVGMSEIEAKQLITKMHGKNRIPTLIKKANQLSKQTEIIQLVYCEVDLL
jgi:deoxyribonuclease V